VKHFLVAGTLCGAALLAGCYDAVSPLTSAQRAVSPNLSTMNVTDVRVLTLAQASGGLTVPQGGAHQAYLVYLTNVGTTDTTVPQFSVAGDLLGAAGDVSLQHDAWQKATVARASRGTTSSSGLRLSPRNAVATQFEATLRARATRQAIPFFRSALARRDLVHPRFDVLPPPSVGSTMTINVPADTSDCTHPSVTHGVVKAVSQRAIVVSDIASPAGGFQDTAFQAIAAEFDALTYPTITNYFGTPSDFDNNGRVIIYFTPFINSLSPVNPDDGYVGGTFFQDDLLPKSVCPASNAAELFYVVTPDPNGVVTQPFPTEGVRQIARGVLAHEFVHMINAGGRISNPASKGFESAWLDEGLAHLSEHIVGRAFEGINQEQALTIDQLRAMDESSWFAFFQGNLVNAYLYMERPDTIGPIATETHVETNAAERGAIWALLQYAGDQFSHGDRRTLIRGLVASADTGVSNLVTNVGVPLDTLLTHWHTTLAMSPYSIGIDPTFQYTSYRWWNIYSSIVGPGREPGYPLAFAVLPDSNLTVQTPVAQSGAVFIGVVQSPQHTRHIRIAGLENGVDNPNLRIVIIRVN